MDNKVVNFIKRKPIIFGAICFSVLLVIIIIIAIAVSSGKKSDSKNGEKDICDNQYSDQCLLSKMIEKQTEYPEGMPWTNSNCYSSKYLGYGCGCAGFAYMLSDVCFGELKATKLSTCPDNYKVGDVVRMNGNTHSVIILSIDLTSNTITIAEGNFNSSIHWGRTIKINQFKADCNYVMRRNPN